MDDEVVISVDPHKGEQHRRGGGSGHRGRGCTAAVREHDGRVPAAAGVQQPLEQRRWAVEGCHGAGRSLAQRLVGDGELVLDVPAELAARVRVYSQGHGRKTDLDDAVSIGLAALNSSGVASVRAGATLVSLRLLSDLRDELGALRTHAVCRFHRLLAELIPGGMHRGLKASRAQQLLAKVRPQDPVAHVQLQLTEEHLEDIRALDAKMEIVREQIRRLVDTTGTKQTQLYGVGPIIAGRILAEVETIDRFPSKDHFASYNGSAPIYASSGDQVRHRLCRAGNR